jgi:hypothetical protein
MWRFPGTNMVAAYPIPKKAGKMDVKNALLSIAAGDKGDYLRPGINRAYCTAARKALMFRRNSNLHNFRQFHLNQILINHFIFLHLPREI